MVRVVIGSILGGVAQWLIGFLMWGTPLGLLAFKAAPDAANAAVQAALAQNLTPSGTGSYVIPWPNTPQGSVLYGRGPVAMVHFNTGGFAATDPSAILGGLILSIVTMLLIGLALWTVADRVRDFASRAKLVVLFAAATTLYLVWGEPVFNPFLPWGYFIYLGVGDLIGLIVGGLIIVRWFLPSDRTV